MDAFKMRKLYSFGLSDEYWNLGIRFVSTHKKPSLSTLDRYFLRQKKEKMSINTKMTKFASNDSHLHPPDITLFRYFALEYECWIPLMVRQYSNSRLHSMQFARKT